MDGVWLWVGFNVCVLVMLAVDLGLFHRRARATGLREAAAWSVFWVVLSLLFNLLLLRWYGQTPAIEFFAGYVIEKSLSADNLFVFAVLFSYFRVEPRYQHRVLFWGVFGALIMRGALIGIGIALINRFQWVLYVLGAFVLYAGLRMLTQKDRPFLPEKNFVLRWARKFLPLTPDFEGERFFVRRAGAWRATPLVLVLLVLEAADLAFAVDSIPAVFAVTRDPFIVYSSNVCAILGLRALYFLLAGLLPYFRYLNVGLSVVLMLIGAKMLAEPWVKISTPVTLGAIAAVLLIAMLASVLRPRARLEVEPEWPRGKTGADPGIRPGN